MKPRVKLAESAFTGGILSLTEHDGSYSISLDGKELMHSRTNASELLLGSLGVARLNNETDARVLIGGLGLGFTFKSVLESVGDKTTIEVAEMIPEVIEWNRTYLKNLNGSLLDHPQVKTRLEDVTRLIQEAEPHTYDAILLDVDNGPNAMVADSSASLYSKNGIRSICRALRKGGRLAVWSAGPDQGFEKRMSHAGLKVETVRAKAHASAKSSSHFLFLGDL
ncbi:MAG: spermine synthase [Verrucomicrobiota bacterium]|jgi:spermidine synthase|nr:spermine synthase [Verrucomicrobiota bacterium]